MSGILDDVRATIFSPNENRQLFYLSVAEYWPPRSKEFNRIKQAYDYGKDGFRGRLRKDGVTRDFEHSRVVALLLIRWLGIYDPDQLIEAIMHDCPEDLDEWTIERTEGAFSKKNARGLERLTKPSEKDGYSKEDSTRIYFQWFKTADRKFFQKKLSDRLVNMLTCDVFTLEKQEEYLIETERYFLPYAQKFGVLYQELLAVCREVRERITRLCEEKSLQTAGSVPEA